VNSAGDILAFRTSLALFNQESTPTVCGITGYLAAPHGVCRVRDSLSLMCDSLTHRGPDSHGLWRDDEAGVGLGHRRLSIRDLSEAGHQPFISASGDTHLSYNGELYGLESIRSRLAEAGIRLRGHADTEVLAEAIDLWGIDTTLPMLNGMFAFACWSRQRRVLTLVRDRLGIKPLYWGQTRSGSLVFGSELRSLQRCPDLDKSIDPIAVQQYLKRMCVPAPRTIYASCNKLEPGCLVEAKVADREVRCSGRRWWHIDHEVECARSGMAETKEDAVDQLESLVKNATSIRLVSDVPVGVLLSGGIDSSLIAACVAAEAGGETRTFSIGTDDPYIDESDHARRIAAHLGTTHTELTVTEQEALTVVDSMHTLADEPFGDSSIIPTLLVSRLARQHVTVALSGDGGDEFFSGYNRYAFMTQTMRRLAQIPLPARKIIGAIIGCVPRSGWDVSAALSTRLSGRRFRIDADRAALMRRLIASPNSEDCYDSLLSTWSPPPVKHVLADDTDQLALRLQSLSDRDLLDQLSLSDATTYLPDDVLTKVDRASMACSLEVRVPLLDHRVAAFGAAMPASWRFHGSTGKLPLRSLLERSVPRTLWDRPKKGFTAPIHRWLRGDLRQWAESLLTTERLESAGLLPRPIHDAWRRLQAGGTYDAAGIWCVLMLVAWLDTER
jgi:asparagine synthase (glutamine-hydrolysing)